MSQIEPKRLPFSSLDEMIDAQFTIQGAKPYISQELGIVCGAYPMSLIQRMVKRAIPYRVDDYRFVLFDECDFDVTANLRKYHISNGTLGFMGYGGIIQLDNLKDKVKMSGLLLKEDYLRLAMGGKLPSIFLDSQHNQYIHVNDSEKQMIEQLIAMLRQMVELTGHHRVAVQSQVAAIVHYIVDLFERNGAARPVAQSRQQRVFEQFIDLVNAYCTTQHTLDFYADRLCITQRYLGTLVRQASGTTAKEWIDRAIINEAKVALKHSDVTIAALADTLSFPTASFFCKFFKRMTGITPTEYRNQ